MTTAAQPIPLSSVQMIDKSKLKFVHVSEMPEDTYKNFIEAQERFLESRHTSLPDTSNHPAYQPYATVQVDGKVVAQIDNHGWISSSSRHNKAIQGAIEGENSRLNGPNLAANRAEKIAAALGGTVVKADTALTQQSYNATEKIKPMVDYTAMHNDPLYESLLKTKQARTEYIAQQMGQEMTETSTASLETDSSDKTSSDAFLEYMDMTPEERYIMQALAHRGYTKEEFDMLPLEEQEKIMKEIREELREQTQTQTESGQTGFNATNDTAAKQDIVTQIVTITNLLDKQAQIQDDHKRNS
ncbi:MAG: hypothetical protein CL561_03865 [Alphaproteobacteria bacterium]|nr:hypothetical protein [Alphaproteobacteria bacterium]|tara:strand:+ start:502278 stop:503177 length:900 start_codon:yes stop_codon:yes gene_type:complete